MSNFQTIVLVTVDDGSWVEAVSSAFCLWTTHFSKIIIKKLWTSSPFVCGTITPRRNIITVTENCVDPLWKRLSLVKLFLCWFSVSDKEHDTRCLWNLLQLKVTQSLMVTWKLAKLQRADDLTIYVHRFTLVLHAHNNFFVCSFRFPPPPPHQKWHRKWRQFKAGQAQRIFYFSPSA